MMHYKRYLFRLLKDRRDMRWCDNFVNDFEAFATVSALVFGVHTERILQTMALKVIYLEDHPELDTEDDQEKLDILVALKQKEESRRRAKDGLSADDIVNALSSMLPTLADVKQAEPKKPLRPEPISEEELAALFN